MKTCTKKYLMELGFKEYQARRVIQQSKQELVKRGFEFYGGSKIGRVPTWMVVKITGLDLAS
jgi:hypothetical protein